MNDKDRILAVIIISTLVIFLSFCIFAFFGAKLDEVLFYATLGRPEGIDWFLLLLSSIVFGLFFGFLGSIAMLLLVFGYIKKKFGGSVRMVLKISLISYFLALLLVLIAFMLVGKIIPPCPNCVR